MTALIRAAIGTVHHSKLATCLSHTMYRLYSPTLDTWWYGAVNGIKLYSCIASGPAVLCRSHVLCWVCSAAACRPRKFSLIGGTLRPTCCPMQGASGRSGRKLKKESKKDPAETLSSSLCVLSSCNCGAAAHSIEHLERQRLRVYALALLSAYLTVTGEHGQGQSG